MSEFLGVYLGVPFNAFTAARFNAQYDKEQINLFQKSFHSEELRKEAADMAWEDCCQDSQQGEHNWYFYWRQVQHLAGLLARKAEISYRDSLGYVLEKKVF